jgi:hypothetical protein
VVKPDNSNAPLSLLPPVDAADDVTPTTTSTATASSTTVEAHARAMTAGGE